MPTLPVRCPHNEVFTNGFQAIRAELELPTEFSTDVLAEADDVAARGPVLPPGVTSPDYIDRLDLELVTVDPPGSQDLDQAYAAERRPGGGYRVFYAIADVAAFVAPGGAIDRETYERGVTLYSPDMRTPLHPTVLSEAAASLLPGQDRPSLLWTIDLDTDGTLENAHIERATVRSREQLDYATAQQRIDATTDPDDTLGLLKTIGLLREAQEAERGAVSLSLPAQEVVAHADGSFGLEFDQSRPVEGWNAQISLLTGIAAAKIMLDGKVGLLRTLPTPYKRTVRSIRQSALALGIEWPKDMSYPDRVRDLDPNISRQAALLTQAARALRGAGYVAFNGEIPELRTHSAIASEYAHVTAPLRRIADRFANEILLAQCADTEAPEWAVEALTELPGAMGRGIQRDRRLEKAILDFVEALVLEPRVGESFDAVVVDVDDEDAEARIQIRDPAVVAKIPLPDSDGDNSNEVELGEEIAVTLVTANPAERTVSFAPPTS